MTGILNVADFDFDVPQDLIAQDPLPRGTSRMLVCPPGPVGTTITDSTIGGLVDWLRKGDVLVLNDTRVLNARLHGSLPSGGGVEFLLLHPSIDSATIYWWTMAKPGRKLKLGTLVQLPGSRTAQIEEIRLDGTRRISISGNTSTFQDWLQEHGNVPLPPYVRRKPNANDALRYQTAWAASPGAVAAPTAGLHLAQTQLDELVAKGVKLAKVTLHVGAGTFQPVSVENALDHPMHREWWEMPGESALMLTEARSRGDRIVCVGTTALRVVETVWREHGAFVAGRGETNLFVHPLDPPRAVQGLLTNFHWPRTTLILLVAGWLGSRARWKEVYDTAVERKYRLFSYGDCMLSLTD